MPKKSKSTPPLRLYEWFILCLVGIICLVVAIQSLTTPRRDICTNPVSRAVVNSDLKFEQLWMRCEGLPLGSPGLIIHNGLLIAADFYSEAITGYDLQSGEDRWSVYTDGVRGLTLDVPRERVYTYTISGRPREMYSIDANTGNVIWYKDTRTKEDTKRSCRPILLADGKIIAPCLGYQLAYPVDVETGEFGNPNITPYLPVFNDGHAWLLNQGYLTAVDAITGNVVWQSAQLVGNYCCLNDVQVNDELVLAVYRSSLVAFNPITREQMWSNPNINLVGNPVLTKDQVFVLDLQATLHILNSKDGSVLGTIQFEPPKPGQDNYLLAGDSISGSQLMANNDGVVAIYFGDTYVLSVYHIELQS